MHQYHSEIARLVARTVGGTASPEEEKLLEQWLADDVKNRKIYENVVADMGATLDRYERFRGLEDFTGLKGALTGTQRRRSIRTRWIAAVAAVLIPALIITGILIGNRPQAGTDEMGRTSVARLILDDGTERTLSPGESQIPYGVLVEQDGAVVLSYHPAATGAAQSGNIDAVNRIMVPRGSDYRIELSDGTTVHLNADTEIEFPVRFSGGTREVHLKGQAYFNVARNEREPFIVRTSRSEITVLGTEFDICDYSGQPNRTTLVKGSVAVADASGQTQTLIPGQQAEITEYGVAVHDVHIMLYTSWKDGYFMFKDARVADIMEKLSEWYDSEYVISDPWLEDVRITARLKKYDDINQILDVLGFLNELDFKIEGKTIIVYQSQSGRQ